MARVNPTLVYKQDALFIRRDPANTQLWQVIDGKFTLTDGKRTGFELSEVVETGIAKGNLARVRATAHSAERLLTKQTA